MVSPQPSTRRAIRRRYCPDCGASSAPTATVCVCGRQLEPLTSAGTDVDEALAAEQWSASNNLLMTVRQGDVEGVRTLLKSGGCNLDQPGAMDGVTALMWACCQGDAACVGLLLEAGATVDAAVATNAVDDSRGRTALMYASQSGEMDCVRQLLQAKADITLIDAKGKSAVNHAWQGNHFDVVQMLEAPS